MSDRRKPETRISKGIKDMLDGRGILNFRINCGSVRVRGGRMHGAPTGFPDRWTELGFLECKTPEGKLSEAQKAIHAKLKAAGHRVGVAPTAVEASALIDRWLSAREFERSMGWSK